MTIILKDCPFCGATPKGPPIVCGGSDERSGYNFNVKITCHCCGVEMDRPSHQNKGGWCDDSGQAEAAVIAAWNRRVVV